MYHIKAISIGVLTTYRTQIKFNLLNKHFFHISENK